MPYSGVPFIFSKIYFSPSLFSSLLPKYIPLTNNLSLSFSNFHRIPWASWHQIYQCPFISRNSSILSSWCLRLITLPVFWILPLPVSQALLFLLYFQPLPLQLRIRKSISLPPNKQKQPKASLILCSLPATVQLLLSVPHHPLRTRFTFHHIIKPVLNFYQ